MINSKLKKKLDNREFVFTAETSPPDSSNKEDVIDRIENFNNLPDAVNVTDGASAKSHLSALVTSSILANAGVEPVLQLTTRDRNRIALQSDLLGAWILNVPNILCIYGDQVSSGDQPETKEVRDLDTLQLIKTAKILKEQKMLPQGRFIKCSPEYFIGGADTPFDFEKDFNCKNLLKKIENGVDFFQTQFAFDKNILKKYMIKLNEYKIPQKAFYLVGLGVLKSSKSAIWMNKNLYGINIPSCIIDRLEKSNNQKQEGIKICIELIEEYMEIEGVHGVHLMGFNQEKEIAEVISKFKKV